MKITGPQTAADKTHIRPENLLYIIMFKIGKIKPNLSSVWQKPKSFDNDCLKHGLTKAAAIWQAEVLLKTRMCTATADTAKFFLILQDQG